MYSCPALTSSGTMCPGSFVAKEIPPGEPMARYSVMNNDPPPATRFSTPKIPPPPPNWVCVVIWMELVIQESSPASEMTDSLGSSANSRTGMVVPRMRLCMADSWSGLRAVDELASALSVRLNLYREIACSQEAIPRDRQYPRQYPACPQSASDSIHQFFPTPPVVLHSSESGPADTPWRTRSFHSYRR